MLYQKSLTNLAKAPDLWAAVGPGSEARSQQWLERQGDGTVNSFIITCRQAYQALDVLRKHGHRAAQIGEVVPGGGEVRLLRST